MLLTNMCYPSTGLVNTTGDAGNQGVPPNIEEFLNGAAAAVHLNNNQEGSLDTDVLAVSLTANLEEPLNGAVTAAYLTNNQEESFDSGTSAESLTPDLEESSSGAASVASLTGSPKGSFHAGASAESLTPNQGESSSGATSAASFADNLEGSFDAGASAESLTPNQGESSTFAASAASLTGSPEGYFRARASAASLTGSPEGYFRTRASAASLTGSPEGYFRARASTESLTPNQGEYLTGAASAASLTGSPEGYFRARASAESSTPNLGESSTGATSAASLTGSQKGSFHAGASAEPLTPNLGESSTGAASAVYLTNNPKESSSNDAAYLAGCLAPAPPQVTPLQRQYINYYFEFPQRFVGQLIGKQRRMLNDIEKESAVKMSIKEHPHTTKTKLVSIKGTLPDVLIALEIIRERFPYDIYPEVTLSEASQFAPPSKFDYIWLPLARDVDNEVIIMALNSPTHLFVLQPKHPDYKLLIDLHDKLRLHYYDQNLRPPSAEIKLNSICVAPGPEGWYRVLIVGIDEQCKKCLVRYLDFGGTMIVYSHRLKQIHGEFLALPFQAVECRLADIEVINNDELAIQANNFIRQETYQKILRANIVGYDEVGIPLVHIYTTHCNQLALLNQLLVDWGFARIKDSTDVPGNCYEIPGGSTLNPLAPEWRRNDGDELEGAVGGHW